MPRGLSEDQVRTVLRAVHTCSKRQSLPQRVYNPNSQDKGAREGNPLQVCNSGDLSAWSSSRSTQTKFSTSPWCIWKPVCLSDKQCNQHFQWHFLISELPTSFSVVWGMEELMECLSKFSRAKLNAIQPLTFFTKVHGDSSVNLCALSRVTKAE